VVIANDRVVINPADGSTTPRHPLLAQWIKFSRTLGVRLPLNVGLM
jgi:hypothetical protein